MTAKQPIGFYLPDSAPAQTPAEVAVVMPTVLRSSIAEALESVYAQDFKGRVQLMVGVDVAQHPAGPLMHVLGRRPAHVSAMVLALPYSTSTRHGGVHSPEDGGSLRAVLSLAANARYVAYLDDDNTWLPAHLRLLHEAIGEASWAFTQRMIVDKDTDEDLVPDIWDSAGPGRGRLKGGFVDTNCLFVDKAKLAHAFAAWAQTLDDGRSFSADRRFFQAIAAAPHVAVPTPTVRYRIPSHHILRIYMEQGSDSPQAMAAAAERIRALLQAHGRSS